MDSKCINLINELCNRIKRLEYINTKKENKSESFQYILELSENLSDTMEIMEDGTAIYQTMNPVKVFEKDLKIKGGQKNLNIIVSGSFILEIEDGVDNTEFFGTVIMRIKINDIIVTENEVRISNNGFSHISLNYNLEVNENLIYTIIVEFDGSTLTEDTMIENVALNTRKDGISISILIT